ncbi:MAG: amidotransferase [Bacteroidetes bacterium]|jgi:GMP synthase (glutamine-hydrolysing)|nr:amidotransferase [Bacteroidota bacterium]
MKKLLIIQHVPFEGPGAIEKWAAERNYLYNIHKVYANERFPDVSDISGLVVMGGPMSVNDHAIFPWISDEIGFIKECIKQNVPVVGICLGAQFLAKAMNAKVYKAKEKEIGWFPITFNISRFPDKMQPVDHQTDVFHWHGETFDLPGDCKLLASSKSTPNQLFLYEKRILGIQFHIELNHENINQLIENCREELSEHGPYIMSEEAMKMKSIDYPQLHTLLYNWFDYIFQGDSENVN